MLALGGESVGEPLIKSLWLARLPSGTQSVLAAINENLTHLATIADKIHDLNPHSSVNMVHALASNNNPQYVEMQTQIAQLTKQVQELSSMIQKQDRARRRKNYFRRSRGRSNSRTRYKEAKNGVCFYHVDFGLKAKKCKSPCTYREAEN
nr:uncharacterized protein LOC107437259 [Parasteatoda tepidariorum]